MTQGEETSGGAGGGAAPPTPVAYSQIGRYKILRELGRGAMGVVYAAVDPKIGRTVALKVLHDVQGISPQELEEFRSRFFREARTAGMLSHRNIVVIHDVDADEQLGITYMAMELLKGQSVRDLQRSGVKFTTEQVVDVVTQVAEGLDHAHRQGIVHRDVKPDNLMFLEDGTVKITDFGIAKISTSNLTRTGQFIGTPNYMSPEQVIGHVIDGRSDLFSLGIILYELLTGEKPFMGSSLTTITYQIVNVDPIEPSKIRPGIPKAFDQIVAKLLRKAPDERYPTGKDVSEALRGLRDGAAPSAAGSGTMPAAAAGGAGAPPLPAGPGDATQVSRPGVSPAPAGTPTVITAGQPEVVMAEAGRGIGKPVIGAIAAIIVLGAAAALVSIFRGEPEPPVASASGASGPVTLAAGASAPLVPADRGASGASGAAAGATGAHLGASAPVEATGAGASSATAPTASTAGTGAVASATGAAGAAGATGQAAPPPRPPAPKPTRPVKPLILPPRAGTLPGSSTAPAAADPVPVALSTVNVVLEHKLKEGSLTVFIDGKQAYGLSVESTKKRGKDSVSGQFKAPDGRHEVRVCLASPEIDDGPKCAYKEFAFVMNRTATLRATHGKPPIGKHLFAFTME